MIPTAIARRRSTLLVDPPRWSTVPDDDLDFPFPAAVSISDTATKAPRVLFQIERYTLFMFFSCQAVIDVFHAMHLLTGGRLPAGVHARLASP
ncbi:hypothetical protein PQR22_15005 [Paraburkholderia megapolitana]|nr:hypothetical protein [Paraburkholderia megapolitana]